jgi:hypothetical protein
MRTLADRYREAKGEGTDEAWRSFASDLPANTARVVTVDSGMVVLIRDRDGGVKIVPAHDFVDARQP